MPTPRMNQEQFIKHIQTLHAERMKVMISRQAKYVPGLSPEQINPFGNFERRAGSLKRTPVEVCINDLSKHYDCICGMVRREVPLSHALIRELATDLHNYIDLVYGQLLNIVDDEVGLQRYDFYETPDGHEQDMNVVKINKEMPGSEKISIARRQLESSNASESRSVLEDTETPIPPFDIPDPSVTRGE